MVNLNGLFTIKGSEELATFFKDSHEQTFTVFSVDIKDLYYSLPYGRLLEFIEHRHLWDAQVSKFCWFDSGGVYRTVFTLFKVNFHGLV